MSNVVKKNIFAAKLGYTDEQELVFHYPRRHEDRSRWLDPFSASLGEAVTVMGVVASQKLARWRYRRSCFEVALKVEGATQTLKLVWFNMPYLGRVWTEGRRMIVHGKITENKKGARQIHHPEFEAVTEGEENVHLNRIVPVYPTTEGVPQRALRAAIFSDVTDENFYLPEIQPAPAKEMTRTEAVRSFHFPATWEDCRRARRRLAFDEFFRMQLLLAVRRQTVQRVVKERSPQIASLAEPFCANLPFSMTQAQKRVCGEIDADLKQPHPMNRLLQGDVGSGKTLVAVHALLRTLETGLNGALLAPTEILAEQHCLNLKKWLEPLGVQVELWTRSHRPSLEDSLFGQRGKVFVGTHALIQEKAALPKLGLGVIDEQHKFGVLQRIAFQEKGEHPDLLVMTATPIPRTLCLTLYGDLDVAVLDEMPPGRGCLRTALRSTDRLPKIWDFVKKEITAGRQAYVVYPLVEDSEKVNLKSVEKEAGKLRGVFGEDQVRVLHGRMDSETKEEIMRDFRAGRFSVLVATTVIEVGVDVPNASVMVIENAERFGLAQLHQLRGRVGRGPHQSFCVLVSDAADEESWQRLQIMEQTGDGFRLAEEDLKLRGPGDVLGTEQSGLPPLRVANFGKDWDVLTEARAAARRLLQEDPTLQKWPELKKELKRYLSEDAFPSVN
ncbi:MAG: ATP-dependent DNA helicase RecG [bacterium]